jgi:hypothetical protein
VIQEFYKSTSVWRLDTIWWTAHVCKEIMREIILLAPVILSWAATRFLKPRGHGFGRQIIFWLIALSVLTAVVASSGWSPILVFGLFLNFALAVFMLSFGFYARRGLKRLETSLGAMSSGEREQALSKMPPNVRQAIVQELAKRA